MNQNQRQKTALISVYNKDGIVEFASRLVELGWKIVGSMGTVEKLTEAGIEAQNVAEFVGGEPILGHRVVTLSRELHAGLLANKASHHDTDEMWSLNLDIIDLVCCDFYPLIDAINSLDGDIDSVVEQTDIGGPCMVRSGAKGLRIVICRHEDRLPVLEELEEAGDVSETTRQWLRARAEFEVARYVGVSAAFHSQGAFLSMHGERIRALKYGENPWQKFAALHKSLDDDPLAIHNFELVEGSTMGYINYTDLDRGLATLSRICANATSERKRYVPAMVGVKHGNACCASVQLDNDTGFVAESAITGDSRAIFGGTVICNFRVDERIAKNIAKARVPGSKRQIFDVIAAPEFTHAAIETLSRVRGGCRMLVNPALATHSHIVDTSPVVRQVRGGFMIQGPHACLLTLSHPDIMVNGANANACELSDQLRLDLYLAWSVCATSTSNTITIVKYGQLIGNGVGQQDRVGAAELAVKRAVDAGHEDKLHGAVACSDSFFPFDDGPKVLIDAGVKTIFATRGSKNDQAVLDTCIDAGVRFITLPNEAARGFYGH